MLATSTIVIAVAVVAYRRMERRRGAPAMIA